MGTVQRGGGAAQSPQLTSRTQAPWLILAATTATENHNYAVYNTYTWATRRDTQCLPFTFCKSRPHPSGPGFRCSRIWGQNRPPMLYSLLWHTSSLTGDRIRKVFCSRKKKKEMEKKKIQTRLHDFTFTWHDNKILVSPWTSFGEQIQWNLTRMPQLKPMISDKLENRKKKKKSDDSEMLENVWNEG